MLATVDNLGCSVRVFLREGRDSGQSAFILLFTVVVLLVVLVDMMVLVSAVHHELRCHHLELDVSDRRICGAIRATIVDRATDHTVRVLDHHSFCSVLERRRSSLGRECRIGRIMLLLSLLLKFQTGFALGK